MKKSFVRKNVFVNFIWCLKIAGVSYRVWDIWGILWVFPDGLDFSVYCPTGPTGKHRSCPLYWEKVGVAATVAPSFLGTNTFVLKHFLPSSAFSIVFSTEKVHRSQILHLSISFGKVLTFGISANVKVYYFIIIYKDLTSPYTVYLLVHLNLSFFATILTKIFSKN